METPDPLKDLEPTEPFVSGWLDDFIDFVCEHPVIITIGVVMVAVGAATL